MTKKYLFKLLKGHIEYLASHLQHAYVQKKNKKSGLETCPKKLQISRLMLTNNYDYASSHDEDIAKNISAFLNCRKIFQNQR